MKRTTQSVLLRFLAPIMLIFLAITVRILAFKVANSPILAGLHSPVIYVALGLFASGVLWMVVELFRVWQWDAGKGPACPRCGGMLGFVRQGTRRRSDYRKCLGCGGNHNGYNVFESTP